VFLQRLPGGADAPPPSRRRRGGDPHHAHLGQARRASGSPSRRLTLLRAAT